jgi:hypothetical protein
MTEVAAAPASGINKEWKDEDFFKLDKNGLNQMKARVSKALGCRHGLSALDWNFLPMSECFVVGSNSLTHSFNSHVGATVCFCLDA